jgi:hypothetical protein
MALLPQRRDQAALRIFKVREITRLHIHAQSPDPQPRIYYSPNRLIQQCRPSRVRDHETHRIEPVQSRGVVSQLFPRGDLVYADLMPCTG